MSITEHMNFKTKSYIKIDKIVYSCHEVQFI